MSTASRPWARTLRRGALALASIGMLGVAMACGDDPTGPSGGEGRMQVLLAAAPAETTEAAYAVEATEHGQVEWADVRITRVYLTGGGQGQVDLFDDPDSEEWVDLLALEDGATVDLTGEVSVPAGNYGQLRFEIAEARVQLAGEGEPRDLQVPSGFIRVLLHGQTEEDLEGSIEVEEGETTLFLVGFDLSQSFVFQGPPGDPHGVLFKPVLRELSQAGEPEDP